MASDACAGSARQTAPATPPAKRRRFRERETKKRLWRRTRWQCLLEEEETPNERRKRVRFALGTCEVAVQTAPEFHGFLGETETEEEETARLTFLTPGSAERLDQVKTNFALLSKSIRDIQRRVVACSVAHSSDQNVEEARHHQGLEARLRAQLSKFTDLNVRMQKFQLVNKQLPALSEACGEDLVVLRSVFARVEKDLAYQANCFNVGKFLRAAPDCGAAGPAGAPGVADYEEDVLYVCKKSLESLRADLYKGESIFLDRVGELAFAQGVADEELMVPVDMRSFDRFDSIEMLLTKLGPTGAAVALVNGADKFEANKKNIPAGKRPNPITAREWRAILECG